MLNIIFHILFWEHKFGYSRNISTTAAGDANDVTFINSQLNQQGSDNISSNNFQFISLPRECLGYREFFPCVLNGWAFRFRLEVVYSTDRFVLFFTPMDRPTSDGFTGTFWAKKSPSIFGISPFRVKAVTQVEFPYCCALVLQ